MAKASTTRERRANQKFEQAARQADRGTRPARDKKRRRVNNVDMSVDLETGEVF